MSHRSRGRSELREPKPTLFGELKRRNVFRVAVVYLGTAWLIVHVGTVLGETLETPHWVMRFVILVLTLGFPGALAFAWAFEVTPKGVRRTREVLRRESITHLTGRKLDFVIIGVLATGFILVVLWAWIPNEPLFQPYLKDPEIAALLAKHAERRATWRQQLAAEGL